MIFIRLTPKSSRDAIEGVETSADGRVWLKARVRAVPEDGKANRALEKLVARVAGVAKSDVTIVAGHTSRTKTVRIDCNPGDWDEAVERLGGPS